MIAVTIIALTATIDILKYQGSTIRFMPAITTVITTTPRPAATTFTHIFLERARNATGSAKAMTVIVFMPAPIQPSAPRPISAQRIPFTTPVRMAAPGPIAEPAMKTATSPKSNLRNGAAGSSGNSNN